MDSRCKTKLNSTRTVVLSAGTAKKCPCLRKWRIHLAEWTTNDEKRAFDVAQPKVKQIILASLSMELEQRVMVKKTVTEMRKYLVRLYEGIENSATRTNREIVLYHKPQAAKCKPNWDVAKHVDNMFMMRSQPAALKADMRDRVSINLLMRSLPPNHRFDRLRDRCKEVETPEKLKDQIIRKDSNNKCDRELAQINGNSFIENQGQNQKLKQHQQSGQNAGIKQLTPQRTAALATKKADQPSGNCYFCHKPGHMRKDCNKRTHTKLA
ncbi:Hypothetical protein PHPALM_18413 [Phytophthora palmivora]|uniref:CCHC-type domain-containing protein n=1 Tax=Phytophthora palmivora TaxID=4796 RepID=A0A2P4XJT3_9STRA|nr:Hypothetical protein PHPALM_18413 [Phytophthora palmivora]